MTRITEKLTAHWARLTFGLLTREGLDADSLFKQSGLDTSQLADSANFFSQDNFSKLWNLASRESGNPAIGLKMGMNPSINAFDIYSSSIISSSSVRDALARAVRYQKIVGTALTLTQENRTEGCLISFASRGNQLPVAREGYDAALALMATTLRSITAEPIVPLYVEFCYTEPADLLPYEIAFNCPLRFAGKQYSICIDKSALGLPLMFASQGMVEHHEEMLDRAIKALDNEPLSNRVSQFIGRHLPGGEPTVLQAAQALHISPRTMQRHLQLEGKSFRSLLDDIRKTLALDYVTDRNLQLQEITFLLGFSDHSNFYRAFRRWYGCAPGSFREHSLSLQD